MNKKDKRTLNSIFLFLGSLIFFFLAYIGFTKQDIDLNNCSKIESTIVDKGVAYRYGRKGRKSKSFYILLKDKEKKLGVYRMSKNYSDLLEKFNIGDTVVAYFLDNNNESENINIDLVQVNRNREILLNKKEYERKESSLIYIGLVAGIITIIISYFNYKKSV